MLSASWWCPIVLYSNTMQVERPSDTAFPKFDKLLCSKVFSCLADRWGSFGQQVTMARANPRLHALLLCLLLVEW